MAHLYGLDARKQRRYRLGEVRMISVKTFVRGEEAVIPVEPAATAYGLCEHRTLSPLNSDGRRVCEALERTEIQAPLKGFF